MTTFKPRLHTPGPVEVPPAVLQAMAGAMIHHRTPAFEAMFLDVRRKLATLAEVEGEDVLVLAGSGTAALEAGLLAVAPAGAKVLGLQAGKFGARWLSIARSHGFQVVEVAAAPGNAIDPKAVRDALANEPGVEVVIGTHSETSTGVLHDIAAIAAAVRAEAPRALFLVDAVSSLAAAELRPKAWGIDGVLSGSQKGLMTPPGLAFAWLSERAWKRHEELAERAALPPSFYLNLGRERGPQAKGQTACTPAVSLVAGLSVALDMLLAEGNDELWRRRERFNEALLRAGEVIGLRRFAQRVSPATAALATPEGVSAPDIVRQMKLRGFTIAGGQDDLKPRLIRPSVVGYADRYDVGAVAAALEGSARAVGLDVATGDAVRAALITLDAEPSIPTP